MSTINSVAQIAESGSRVLSWSELPQFVEAPVLPACQKLYDLGIETVYSGANTQYGASEAHIKINMKTLGVFNYEKLYQAAKLNPESIKIIKRQEEDLLGITHHYEDAVLSFPINSGDSVSSVEQRMNKLVDDMGFTPQPAFWMLRDQNAELADGYLDPATGLKFRAEKLVGDYNTIMAKASSVGKITQPQHGKEKQ